MLEGSNLAKDFALFTGGTGSTTTTAAAAPATVTGPQNTGAAPTQGA